MGVGVLCLLGSLLDWTGWIAMLIFILFMAYREKLLQRKYLQEEVGLEIITTSQYFTAQSTRSQFAALFKGHFFLTLKFYQLCAELAHKKSQLERFGDENGNTNIISNLRNEMRHLSPNAAA